MKKPELYLRSRLHHRCLKILLLGLRQSLKTPVSLLVQEENLHHEMNKNTVPHLLTKVLKVHTRFTKRQRSYPSHWGS